LICNLKLFIKSKILHILHKSTATKIPARKCVIKQLTGASCRDFIEQYHVQGFSPATVYLGAFYNDKLIGCMTFSSIGRFNKHALPSTYELIRYVTSNTIISTGLASKLLQYFIINFNPSKIISYADRRFTIKDQNVYTKLGFTLIDVTPPNYFYIKGSRRYHRLKFQKHKLSNILPTFDSAMTEWENMKLNKYDRIWDCGHLKYELIVK
jgi:hypothetical protein